jgi:hypothetical protein
MSIDWFDWSIGGASILSVIGHQGSGILRDLVADSYEEFIGVGDLIRIA